MTNNIIDDFPDLTAEEAIQAEAYRQEHARRADETFVLNMLGIDPLPNRRRDPEPAQVRESSWQWREQP